MRCTLLLLPCTGPFCGASSCCGMCWLLVALPFGCGRLHAAQPEIVEGAGLDGPPCTLKERIGLDGTAAMTVVVDQTGIAPSVLTDATVFLSLTVLV